MGRAKRPPWAWSRKISDRYASGGRHSIEAGVEACKDCHGPHKQTHDRRCNYVGKLRSYPWPAWKRRGSVGYATYLTWDRYIGSPGREMRSDGASSSAPRGSLDRQTLRAVPPGTGTPFSGWRARGKKRPQKEKKAEDERNGRCVLSRRRSRSGNAPSPVAAHPHRSPSSPVPSRRLPPVPPLPSCIASSLCPSPPFLPRPSSPCPILPRPMRPVVSPRARK